MSINKKIEILTLTIYTILNLYVIGNFIFKPYWSSIVIAKEIDFVFFGVVVGLFLNAALVIYSIRRNKD